MDWTGHTHKGEQLKVDNFNCVFYQKPLLWSGRTTHLSLNIKARTFKGRLQYITNIHPRRCNYGYLFCAIFPLMITSLRPLFLQRFHEIKWVF